MKTETKTPADHRTETCLKCQAELDADGDCPVCDPWLEDEFEDDFDN